MIRKHLRAATLLGLALFSVPAQATVDGFIEYHVPYFHPQTEDICLMKQTMFTSFGVPEASQMHGTLAQTRIFADQPAPRYLNINLAGTSPAMVGTYVTDAVTDTGVFEYSMRLDLGALAAANGAGREGRAATVKAAKLFLIAMAANMASISYGSYRLRVQLIGLPSQQDLPGTPLYATTLYAYSAGSPLLAAYRRELLNVEGSCPDGG
jgi:hypothetical protein